MTERAVAIAPALPVVSRPAPASLMRVADIDWDYLTRRRPAVLKHAKKLPAYLLLPEVRALLAWMHQANTRLLFSTIWHTGARISEALALTRDSFELDPRDPYVSLQTLKKRGRPKRGAACTPPRMVPLRDLQYLDLLKTYFATHRPRADERLFPISRQAADARLRTVLKQYSAAQGPLSIAVSCHTWRHSFAVNCVLHGTPLTVLQGWLGHAHIESTAIYTQVLTAETGHLMAGIEF